MKRLIKQPFGEDQKGTTNLINSKKYISSKITQRQIQKMQINSCMTHEIQIREKIDDIFKAYKALKSKSKLRQHYLTLVDANNIMRAMVVLYDVKDYELSQEAFLKTLCAIEARKNRAVFTSDLIVIFEAINNLKIILESCTQEQYEEAMQIVNRHEKHSKYIITSKK